MSLGTPDIEKLYGIALLRQSNFRQQQVRTGEIGMNGNDDLKTPQEGTRDNSLIFHGPPSPSGRLPGENYNDQVIRELHELQDPIRQRHAQVHALIAGIRKY
jgi:hypothetical protein